MSDDQQTLLVAIERDEPVYTGRASMESEPNACFELLMCWLNRMKKSPIWISGVCCALMLIIVPLMMLPAIDQNHERESDYLSEMEQSKWGAYQKDLKAARRTEWPICHSSYEHTCGKLLASNTGSGAFQDIRANIETSLREIISDGWPLIGSWYDACMNVTDRNIRAAGGLGPLFQIIYSVTDGASLSRAAAQLQLAGVDVLFSIGVAPDEVNTNVNSLYIDAARPVVTSSNTTALRAAMAALIGSVAADQAVYLEANGLFPYVMTTAQKRSFEATYNVVTGNLQNAISPSGIFNWTIYMDTLLSNRSLPEPVMYGQQVVLVQPAYATQVEQMLLSTQRGGSWDAMKSYMVYRTIARFYQDLPPGTCVNAQDGNYMSAQCLNSIEAHLGDVLGHYYVAQNFPPASKDVVNTIVNNTIEAFERRIRATKLFDDSTRAEALLKLESIKPMVAYPDKWDDSLPPFVINDYDHLGNVVRATASESRAAADSFFQSPDHDHWAMRAFDVNAYFNGRRIALTAGILQGAFFDVDAPLAVQYGGAGFVVAHEIAHAFDDQNIRYDAEGYRRDWLSNSSRIAYEQNAQCVVRLYDSFVLPTGGNIDGEMTLGENLADLNGLSVAFDAYTSALRATYPKKSMCADYERAVGDVFSLTHQQLFFTAYSFSWCQRISQTTVAYLLLNDVHSPPIARVDCSTQQNADFRKAYDCSPPAVQC